MVTLNVQFSDSTQTVIVAYFGSPQNPTMVANTGTLDSSDSRWANYYNSLPTNTQKYVPAST